MPATVTAQRTALVAILLIGALLRSVQYGALTSLSSDEVALALNVTDRGWHELVSVPLMHNQVAPPGFLLAEKLSVAVLGDTEAAYRFFPFLLSLASLALFWRVAARYLRPSSLLAAMIAFALSPALVLYAGVAKQYAGDIAVVLFLLWTALRYLERAIAPAESIALGIAGGTALLLSQPAVLVAAGLGLLLLAGHAEARRRLERPLAPLVAICAGWFVGAAVVTYASLTTLSPATRDYMDRFWVRDFPPPVWSGVAESLWIPARLAESAVYFVTYVLDPSSLPVVVLMAAYAILTLLGILYLFRRDWRTATLLAVPVVVAVIAAAGRLLPLSGRVSLFLGPSLLVGAFAGFDGIRSRLPGRLRNPLAALALAFALLPALGFLAEKPPPRVTGGTLPVMRDLKARWLPGDRLMFSRGEWTSISVEYYGRRFGLDDWTQLERLRGDHSAEEILRGYLRGIDQFRGAPRVWLFLQETVACEDEAMVGYLSEIGERLHSVVFQINSRNRVSAHLFDLSDPGRLSRSDAGAYPVPECRD
jgi:hypothetical protein